MIRTEWQDELVNGSAVVMNSPIEITAVVMEQSGGKGEGDDRLQLMKEMTGFSL
jgi:hypothetical protein